MSDSFWITAVAVCVAVANALVGSLLVLRKVAMIGDAISHTVLFGLVLVFLVFGTRDPAALLGGAIVVGMLTAILIAALTDHGGVPEDASIGVTFTMLFSVAIILISTRASGVDLDQDCVLNGELALTVFQRVSIWGVDVGPRALWLPLIASISALALVTLCYRRLQAFLFDPIASRVQGVPVALWHNVLMAYAATTIVASFEAVGSIVVLALLVIPPAIASLFVRSLWGLLCVAVLVGIVVSYGGVALAFSQDASLAGSIAVVGACAVALAVAIRLLIGVRRSHV